MIFLVFPIYSLYILCRTPYIFPINPPVFLHYIQPIDLIVSLLYSLYTPHTRARFLRCPHWIPASGAAEDDAMAIRNSV